MVSLVLTLFRSHTRISVSRPPVANLSLLGENARDQTSPRGPRIIPGSLRPVETSQVITCSLAPPAARILPSFENASEKTGQSPPDRVTRRLDGSSQISIFPSASPTARVFSVGEKAKERIWALSWI